MPGKPSSFRSRTTGGVITPRSSATSGSSPSSASAARNTPAPGPVPPPARCGGLVPGRDRPVRDEAAEVVDARHVDELEGAAQPLDPPAVAGRAMRAPVVERIAPVLAARRQRVGRRARDLAALEELRVRDVLGASSAT